MTARSTINIPPPSLLKRIDLSNKYFLLFLLLAFSLMIRLINITSIPIIGDEFGSLRESKEFINSNGILYFVFLRFWNNFGSTVFWYRLPSAIFGSFAVIIFWDWLQRIRSTSIATLAAILFSIAPFAIEYSQNIRFYALFIFTACLFIDIYWHFITSKKTIWKWLALLIGAGLVVGSQFMGVLVVGFVTIHAIYITFRSRISHLAVFLILGVISGGILLLLLKPSLLEQGYLLIRSLSATKQVVSYPGGRGISLITLGKLGVLYSTFAYGSSVYPFNLVFTVPSGIVIVFLTLLGIYHLIRLSDKKYVVFAVLLTIGPIISLYLIFDALWPTTSRDSATPRYIIFVLPLFLWLVAEGVFAISRSSGRFIAAALIIGVQLYGVASLYTSSWSMSPRPLELSKTLQQVSIESKTEPLVIIKDGRSTEFVNFYVGDNIPSSNLSTMVQNPNQLLSAAPEKGSIVFFNSDDRRQMQCDYSPALSAVSSHYKETFAWVNFPIFVYSYSFELPANTLLKEFGQIPMPRAYFPIEFSDLILPQRAVWNGNGYPISGAYFLPACDNSDTMKVDNLDQAPASKVMLFSNLLGAENVSNGTPIATLVLASGDHQTTYSIRKGYETESWDAKECKENCSSVLSWQKRVALLGASAYTAAYRDFVAHIWGAEFSLISNSIDRLEVHLLDPSIRFYIWGMFVK